MGALIGLLFNAARFAGPAAIGYFFNDAATAIGKLFPAETQKKLTDAQGKPKWWFVAIVLLIGGAVLFFLLKFLAGMVKGKKGKMFLLIGAAIAVDQLLGGGSGFIMATVLTTLTTGAAVVTPANTTYVPRYFFYAAATQLTGVKITVQGDGVIFDSDANGLTHCGVNRLTGQVTNTYWFRIANGLITGKNVLWEFTNSAAQTPIVYIDSDLTPSEVSKRLYLQLIRQPAIGPGGTDFTDFATLSFPSMAATDYCNTLYNDGTQQANMTRIDLQAFLQLTQNVVNTPIYMVDNYGMRVKKVNFQATATQTAYVQRWVAPIADGMISQAIIAKG